MAQAGTIRWNGRSVTDLKAERFSLKTKSIPAPQGREMIVRRTGRESEARQGTSCSAEEGTGYHLDPLCRSDEGR